MSLKKPPSTRASSWLNGWGIVHKVCCLFAGVEMVSKWSAELSSMY